MKRIVLFFFIFYSTVIFYEKIKTKKYPFIDWKVPHTTEKVKVEYVFDGDTVRISDGRIVRLLGVNSPEIAHPLYNKPYCELGGEEAKSYTTGELLGKDILLVVDKKNNKCFYGRTLGLLFYDDKNGEQKCFNWELMKAGHANAYIFSDDRLCIEDAWDEEAVISSEGRGARGQ